MRVTVERHGLAVALAQALKYVTNRTDVPVLSTVRLRAGGGEIEVAVTNLDLLFRTTVEADVETEGALAVNSGLIAGFVRGADGSDVELTQAGTLLEMRSGGARGRIPTLPAGDFPEPFGAAPAEVNFEIDGAELAACLESVAYAISTEKHRYCLTGMGWSIQDGRLEFAATDGNFLSMTSIEMPPGAELLAPAIVPDLQMPMFSGPVRVHSANTWIRFSGIDGGRRVELISKLIDGTFPDYRPRHVAILKEGDRCRATMSTFKTATN